MNAFHDMGKKGVLNILFALKKATHLFPKQKAVPPLYRVFSCNTSYEQFTTATIRSSAYPTFESTFFQLLKNLVAQKEFLMCH